MAAGTGVFGLHNGMAVVVNAGAVVCGGHGKGLHRGVFVGSVGVWVGAGCVRGYLAEPCVKEYKNRERVVITTV